MTLRFFGVTHLVIPFRGRDTDCVPSALRQLLEAWGLGPWGMRYATATAWGMHRASATLCCLPPPSRSSHPLLVFPRS